MSQQSNPHLPLSRHLPRQPRNLIAVCPRASSPHTSPERHPEAIGSHDLLLESLFIPLKWGQVGNAFVGWQQSRVRELRTADSADLVLFD